jgi:signal transduction histidine kinase
VNAALADLHGVPVEAHLGRTVREILPPAAAAEIEPLLRQVLTSGEPLVGKEISSRLARGTARHSHLLVSYYPVAGPEGWPIGLGVVATDIAERKQTETRQQALIAEAQRATRLREQVLAIVSHDLKNPLSVLNMSALILERSCPDVPVVRKQLATARRAVDRMDHLISDLLDMSSIEEGRLAVEVVPCAVDGLVDEAIELNAALAQRSGVRLERTTPPLGIEVRADRTRIQQALANLIGNALKFSPPDAAVRVGALARGAEVVLSVEDAGPGIPPEDRPLIFQAYWSGGTQGKKSTGLGLFITKGIVEAHGGRIWVESQVGSGSTFRFTLARHVPRP